MFRNAVRILTRILRAAIPLVLLGGGIASLFYGVAYHSAIVLVEHEIEVDHAPPPGLEAHGGAGFEPPGFGPPGEGFDDPWMGGPPPWMAPPPELLKIKQTIVVNEEVTESALIREITFGGVTRLSSGGLWRTYTGAPPLLCPT